jgi:hypothetical protein
MTRAGSAVVAVLAFMVALAGSCSSTRVGPAVVAVLASLARSGVAGFNRRR